MRCHRWKNQFFWEFNVYFWFYFIFFFVSTQSKKNIGVIKLTYNFPLNQSLPSEFILSSSRNPYSSAYFRFPGSPLFCNSILILNLDSMGNITQDSVLIFYFILMFEWIKSRNNLWKRCKIFYRKFLRSPSIFFDF